MKYAHILHGFHQRHKYPIWVINHHYVISHVMKFIHMDDGHFSFMNLISFIGYIHPCIEFHPCSTFRNHMGMMIIWGFVSLILSNFINWQPLCLPFHLSIFFLFAPLSTSSHLFHSWFYPLGSPFSLRLPKAHPFMWLVNFHICSRFLFCT